MFCSNCGKKMEDNEKFCASCGSKNEIVDYNLEILRPGKVMGCAVDLHVTIGETTYQLSAGKSFKIKLDKGEHIVKYKIWCRREHEVVVNIEDNKVCRVEFVYDALWGGFKVSKKSIL